MTDRHGTAPSRVRWLLSQLKSQRPLYIIGILIAGLYKTVEAILSGALYRSVIAIGEGQSYRDTVVQLLVIFAFIIVIALIRGWAMTRYTDATTRTERRLRYEIVHRFLDMAVPLRSLYRQSEWVNLIARDLNTAGQGIRSIIPLFVSMALAAITSFVVVAQYSVTMVLFVLAAGIFYWLTTNLVKAPMKRARADEQKALRVATGHVHETMQDLLNVRFYGMSDSVDRQLSAAGRDYQRAGRRALHLSVWQISLQNAGYAVGYVGSLALALWLVQRGELILSDAMFIWPMAMQAAYAINRMGNLVIEWQEPAVAIDRMQAMVGVSDPVEEAEAIETDGLLDGPMSVTFDRVSFAYPATDGTEPRPVLRDFSLHIPAGEKVAVLGLSGSGKSTVFKLLLRFYTPTSGRILINDRPIEQIPTAALRAALAYLPQAPRLFKGTIRENFRMINPDLGDDVMRDAMQRVGLEMFAGDDGDILDHEVGVSGNRLSGGERQRFGIARAYVRGQQTYLMDEMTSALDGANDRKVTEMLMALPETTILWITHRTDQLHLADRVITLEHGTLKADQPKRV